MLMMPALFTPHYSIEFRSFFTHWHITVVGFFGATECLLIQMICMIIGYISPHSNEVFLLTNFNLLGYEIALSDIVLAFVFLSGAHYNVENIIYGFLEAKDKWKAFCVFTPYLSVYLLSYLSSYSQFWNQAPMLFITGIGFF
jgi:hypothetical protein